MDSPGEGTTLTPAQQAMADLWDKHMHSEFASQSVEETPETMVDDPYVITPRFLPEEWAWRRYASFTLALHTLAASGL